MFLLLLLLSMVTYAWQGAMVGQLARRHDLLWVCTVRGLSLLVVMAPLLLLQPLVFARPIAWAEAPAHLPHLGLACLGAMVGNLAMVYAMRHLPLAIANACCQGLSALFVLIIEVATTGSWPPAGQLACVGGILAGVAVLGWISSRGAVVAADARPLRGVVACVLFGASMASALIPLGQVSRQVDPFYAAWAWEGGIGLVGLAMIGVRSLWRRGDGIPLAAAWRVGLCSSPTLVGTGAYTWATTLGSLSIASGVLSTMMVGTAIYAWAFYRERLRPAQWATMAAICACLLALGVVKHLAERGAVSAGPDAPRTIARPGG
jgi:drug/metabolite transporter (DMT)-like permease